MEEGWGGPGSEVCSMHVSKGDLQRENVSPHRGRDLVHGMQTPDGAHSRIATNLGLFQSRPPILFSFVSLNIYMHIK